VDKKVNKGQLSAANSHRGWRPSHPEATRLRYEACGIKRPDFQSENGKITEAENVKFSLYLCFQEDGSISNKLGAELKIP
jgi:hypothetical protein